MGFPFKCRLPLSRQSTVPACPWKQTDRTRRAAGKIEAGHVGLTRRWRRCVFFPPSARCTLWVHRHQKKGRCERCEPKSVVIHGVRRKPGSIGIRPEDLEAAYVGLPEILREDLVQHHWPTFRAPKLEDAARSRNSQRAVRK